MNPTLKSALLLGLSAFVVGCAFVPAFYDTALTDLERLSEVLTDTRLDDLFRQHPTLRLVNSTEIGDGNIRHEFSYTTVEKEDESQRPATSNVIYLYERHTTFSINIFVNASGIIYEVLQPVPTDIEVVFSKEKYDRYKKQKPAGDKNRSLPYP